MDITKKEFLVPCLGYSQQAKQTSPTKRLPYHSTNFSFLLTDGRWGEPAAGFTHSLGVSLVHCCLYQFRVTVNPSAHPDVATVFFHGEVQYYYLLVDLRKRNTQLQSVAQNTPERMSFTISKSFHHNNSFWSLGSFQRHSSYVSSKTQK